MFNVLKVASVAGLLAAGQVFSAAADTVSITYDGIVDLDGFMLDDSALIDGEAFTFQFSVKPDALVGGGIDPFFLTPPQMDFEQSGVSFAFFLSASADQTEPATDDVNSPRITRFIFSELTDLFLELEFDYNEPEDASASTVMAAMSDAEFRGAMFTFTGGAAPIGTCNGAIFCGVDLTGPVTVAYEGDGMDMNPSPVPLPAGMWLLLSGLGVIGASKLRRKA